MALIDDIRALRIADYDYNLPDERIAKHPRTRLPGFLYDAKSQLGRSTRGFYRRV